MTEKINVLPDLNLNVERQLEIFRTGIPYMKIIRPATPQNGVEVLTPEEQEKYVSLFESEKEGLNLLKFVPASGAATRMFKFLHQFLDHFDPEKDKLKDFLKKEENQEIKTFLASKDKFAFSNLAFQRLRKKFPQFEDKTEEQKAFLFVREILSEEGLNFGDTPKGLIPFHLYGDFFHTAFEEQLYEAAFYAGSKGVARLHFTISKEHQSKFLKRLDEVQNKIEKETGVKFEISFSFQKEETDTIAVHPDNSVFLKEDGLPLLRPSGHGALLNNLNEADADFIFIKNIDNVVSKRFIEVISFQKKLLAGRLISLQEKIFKYLNVLENENLTEEDLTEIAGFIENVLGISVADRSRKNLFQILNRPIRICGVVKNTGAPGGGPFLVEDSEGKESYQIVEMSQIDLSDPEQKELVDQATHFNPVDLVCAVRDFQGNSFDLKDFMDPDTGFISEKSYQGQPIKALELPGLWNGSMAHWNTVFVEVPLITFNPVKTVNDLLNEAHIPQ